jgi:RNA polymerase sigma factor (sigma-70 family)
MRGTDRNSRGFRQGSLGLAGGPDQKKRTRRHYRPTVEGLEALRLLSGAAQAHPLSGMIAERDLLTDPVQEHFPTSEDATSALVSSATWDAALGHTRLAEFLSDPLATTLAPSGTTSASTVAADSAAVASGLNQLNKYLNRAWYRAGIPAQVHDDNTQAVYTTLLQGLGRQRFDALVGDVGNWGIREVFSRESSEGVAFFRAVDMVKKRARREKVYQSLDSVDVPSDPGDQRGRAAMRAALQDAIDQNLSPREAALIHDTLMGKTPAEIAQQWGVAAKTVSNEKSRVLQKLREALVDHELN